MKKIGLLVMLVFAFLPVPLRGETGMYNTISGVFWCTDDWSCLHEQAHYIDWHNGRISESAEYRASVVVYAAVNGQYELIGYSMTEIYANIYADSGGSAPASLENFYPDGACAFRVINLPVGRLYYGIRNTCH